MKAILSVFVLFPMLVFSQQPATGISSSESKQKIYEEVDQEAVFPGGSADLMKFLSDKVEYPEKAQESGQEGTVFVEFVVAEDGKVIDIKKLKGVTEELDAEAMRVVKAMPNWTPAVKDDKNVASYCRLPIRFQLKK